MPAHEENIYLIGFMGAGKSTVGKLLADILQRPFSDTDFMIEARCGKSIAAIFADRGEAFFREKEKDIVAEIARATGHVVALGGGSVVDACNRRIIEESGISLYLQWPFRILRDRIFDEPTRPLVDQLSTESALRELYEKRTRYYKRADHVIACEGFGSPQEIVAEIMRKFEGEL